MKKIAIITDSDSSLPPQLAAEFGILQVPIGIHFGAESFTTGLDIDDHALFEKVDRLNKLPSTSAPNPDDFTRSFRQAFDAGADAIVCICVSSTISSTYSSAETAREHFPDRDILVIDALDLTMGQGFMVMAAAEAASNNASLAEIAAIVEETRKKLHTMAVLPTLKYLALGGRVDKRIARFSDTINIKPILTVKDGKLAMLEKVRTRKKAVLRMLDLLKEQVADKEIERLAIIHADDARGAGELEALVRKYFHCPEKIIIAEFTPGLSVHAGAGFIGVVIQAK